MFIALVVGPLGVPLRTSSLPCKDPEVVANLPFRTLKVHAIGGVSTIAISNTTGVAEFTRPKAPSSSEKLSGATH